MLKLNFKRKLVVFFLLSFALLNVYRPVFAQQIPGDSDQEPILIKSYADLEVFAQDVFNGNSYEGKHIKLENDVYLTRHEIKDGRAIKWEPIGLASFNSYSKERLAQVRPFNGNFDGNGKTIYCNINSFYQSSEFCKATAIFGCLGKSGTIRNLNVDGKIETTNTKISPATICNINLGEIKDCSLNIRMINKNGVNGISFANYGTISGCNVNGKFETNDLNCSAVSSLNYGKIENCKVAGKLVNGKNGGINGESFYKMPEIAGISTFNKGEILNCNVKADLINAKINSTIDENNNKIENTESYHGIAGGIVATNEGDIKGCTFSGNVSSFYAGGIAGMNYKDVEDCKVSSAKIEGIVTGRIIASNLTTFKEKGVAKNCESDDSVVEITIEQK